MAARMQLAGRQCVGLGGATSWPGGEGHLASFIPYCWLQGSLSDTAPSFLLFSRLNSSPDSLVVPTSLNYLLEVYRDSSFWCLGHSCLKTYILT